MLLLAQGNRPGELEADVSALTAAPKLSQSWWQAVRNAASTIGKSGVQP